MHRKQTAERDDRQSKKAHHSQLSVFSVKQAVASRSNLLNQRYRAHVLREAIVFLCVAGLTGCSQHPARVAAPPAPDANAVEGRVLWNEQPAAGARVVATSLYDFSSTHYGEAITDTGGHFTIRGVPVGEKYLYVFGSGPEYWVSAVTPFVMTDEGAIAADTYLCRGFEGISPARGDSLRVTRPLLRWNAYPGAVDYAVRVIREGERNFLFSRGDRDARVATTSVQMDVDLPPGTYNWRVDAFNQFGHIIGCTRYPQPFVIVQ